MFDGYVFLQYNKYGDIVIKLKVLWYFLAVTREQSISGTAESLYLAQSALFRASILSGQSNAQQFFLIYCVIDYPYHIGKQPANRY